MFYVKYLFAELRRRPGRTTLTALGLAVGVGLVVIVGALSRGLEQAQAEVLEPLTGVGTDLAVSRPLSVPTDGASAVGPAGPFGQLSQSEQRQLQRENSDGLHFDLADLGRPGEPYAVDRFLSTQLSFRASEVGRIRALDGAEDAAASLTLSAIHIEGKVPEVSTPGGAALHGGDSEVTTVSVTGVEANSAELAPVTPDQITGGRFLSGTPGRARDEAVVDLGYARQNRLGVGDELTVSGAEFKIVGLASAPLGGSAANAYVELGRLQRLSDRAGRVNEIRVRASAADAVGDLETAIVGLLPGAEIVTATDLAARVGGSLADADNLASKLGTALAIVALLAAFLIATLLTLSSVQKRIRELGTLKALGWRQRLVVRQITAESLLQGALGGSVGVAIGVGGAAVIDAVRPTLEASVEAQTSASFDPFGQGAVTSGSTEVVLGAPVDPALLVLALALALVGGLIAGAAGGLRAARLGPAEALRSAE